MTRTASGYISEIPYTPQFHREHAPVWLHAVLAALGREGPRTEGAHWCELGCGQGSGLTILAALNPAITFHGIDINPLHIDAARDLAAAAGIENVQFSCADLRDAGDLPDFDCIIARGIYSWVAPETREAIRAFIGQKLRPGGVALLHYLALPGAADFMAIHGLFRALHAQKDISAREAVRAGQALLAQLHERGAGFFASHPVAALKAGQIATDEVDYTAHDYLNEHYRPFTAAEVIADMERAGLAFVGSAVPEDNLDDFSVPENLRAVVSAQKSMAVRETLKDMASNQFSRIDLYCRPSSPLAAPAHVAALRKLRFQALPGLPARGGVTFSTRIGPVEGPAQIFAPIIECFSQGRAVSYAEIEALPLMAANPGLVNQALHALMGAGAIHPVPESLLAVAQARRLNAVLLERHKAGAYVPALAAPGLGSGLAVTSTDLDALAGGREVSPTLKSVLA